MIIKSSVLIIICRKTEGIGLDNVCTCLNIFFTDNIRSCQVQELVIALHRKAVPWRTLLGIYGVIFLLKSESLDHGAHRPVQYHYIFPVKYSHFYIPKRSRIYK